MTCPKCGGECWDNTQKNIERAAEGKKNLPQYSCKDKEGCGWVMWPDKKGTKTILKETGPAPIKPTNGEDKERLMIMSYRKDLMCKLIEVYGETNEPSDIKVRFQEYWTEIIAQPLGRV